MKTTPKDNNKKKQREAAARRAQVWYQQFQLTNLNKKDTKSQVSQELKFKHSEEPHILMLM